MALDVKICGINDAEALRAAVGAGAAYVGFVFFDKSPRALTPVEAGALAGLAPGAVGKVGVFVEAPDDLILEACERAGLDMLQLHGAESPQRVARLRAMTGRPVIKALPIEKEADLGAAEDYEGVCDYLLFDARQPPGSERPGGNARAFDWRLLEGRRLGLPWFLSGGLEAGNLAQAVGGSGAKRVDVSSGVEVSPGVKSARLIREFLSEAAGL